ncbi:hypothetical protein SEMRO_399_G134870.1 [Seminavis robusta]|uniref:Uncharacterized protein n=1 Tax=Seminavis robusta TaxID=568900 RepID=A0A9N8DVC9_9STRA|nr:hypothetical protein SEMRO_399_G134870.1 [Seminavis robusta]|eukprot:Sro399_g134870.1 n/a (535) ;mRNA; r:25900-27715
MEEDPFTELSPDAIRRADEAIANYLASSEVDATVESPITMFIKGEYQSPTGVMTDASPKEHSMESGDPRATEKSHVKVAKKGGGDVSKRKLTPTKHHAPTPSSVASICPPLKRSSIPAGDGKYVLNGTAQVSGKGRTKKPIPPDAVILTIDSDSEGEEEDRKLPAVTKKVNVKKEPEWKRASVPGKKVVVDANNKVTVNGGYEDWQIRAIKKERAAVYEEIMKPPPPPPDGCSFLPAVKLQTSGRTSQSTATATLPTVQPAPTRVQRSRHMSQRPIQLDSSSSSESEDDDSSVDSMDGFDDAEKEKMKSMSPYFRTLYAKELKASSQTDQSAKMLKDKFAWYSKSTQYNGSKENIPKNYLARKKKEWKQKEAQAQVRHLLAKEEKKKIKSNDSNNNSKKKKKPVRSKSLGPTLKLGEWPQYWASESMFHARAIGNPGAKGVHSTLAGGAATPDYRIPALRLKSSDRASKQRLLEAMKVPALKLLAAMTKSTLAQDKTLLYHFVDVNANKEANPPTPVENCVAALIATLVDLYMD